MSTTEPPADWILSQKKVFTNWVNLYLGKRDLQVKDLQTDFSDGVLLCNLMEIISGKRLPTRWKTKAKNRLLQVQNLNIALQFIADEGIKLVACGSEDICDNNLKLIMGMIWTLILRYQIQTGNLLDKDSKKNAKEALMTWVQRNTNSYSDVPVKDFHVSWQDGRAFCALVHRLAPDHIDMSKLSPDDKLANLNLAFDVANKVLGVPKLLDANDIAGSSKPDEQSIMTYVSLFPQLYADKGITVDGSGSNETKNKPEEEEKKKKEDEERKKDEEKKKKDEEQKRNLMVKARSHGEVNKIVDLEDRLRQAEIQVAKLTEANKKSDSENEGLRSNLQQKEKELEKLRAGNSKNTVDAGDLKKSESAGNLKSAGNAENTQNVLDEENARKLKELEESLKKAEEEVKGRDNTLRKAEEEAKEIEERLRRIEEEGKERDERLRKLAEESTGKDGEIEDRMKELLKKLAEAEAKAKGEGENAARWKAESESKDKRLEEAERRMKELENAKKREGGGAEGGLADLAATIQKLGEKAEVEIRDAEKAKRIRELEAKVEELERGAKGKGGDNPDERVKKLEEESAKKAEDIRRLEEVNKLLTERLRKKEEEGGKWEEESAKKAEDIRKLEEVNKLLAERLRKKEEEGGENKHGSQVQELETKLRDKTQEYEAEKKKREEEAANARESGKRAEEYKKQLDDLTAYTNEIRSNTNALVAQLETGMESDKNKFKALEDQLAQAAQDAAKAREIEEQLKKEADTHAGTKRELEELKNSSDQAGKRVQELEGRLAELEATDSSGFAQEIDKKNARIKELEDLLQKRESETKAEIAAYRTKSESHTKDLRFALEQVQSFHDMVSIQGDALTTAKLELQHLEHELSYSNQANTELINEVKQLSRTIAALKAKILHSFSNLPISEYTQFCSGMFAAHSKITVNFSVIKSTLSLSSGTCQFYDENAKPLTKHQEHTKFTSKSELHIDFSAVPEEVSCILVILTLEGGVLVGGESVKGEVLVDYKKEQVDKIDLNIALDKRAAIDKFENSANVPKRLIAIMFSKCEDDENTLWGTVKRFTLSDGIWRVGTVGLFDCEKPAANYGLLHKLLPIKRYGWTANSDIQDIYALIAHLDSTLTLNTKELSRLNQEIGSFYAVQRELEQKLEIALTQKCTHGDQKIISNEALIKYKFLTNSQFTFFGIFLLDVIMQQTSATLSRQLGPANPADPTHSPRTVRNNNTQLRTNVQTELTQIAETEATFKGLMTSSSTLAAEYAQSDEREELSARITRVSAALESLVSQLERDKAIAYAMKSSVQLQQFLGAEAEKLVLDSEKSAEESLSGSPSAGTAGTGTAKKKKSNFVPSPEDINTLLDEFRAMTYVENEDTIPQDMPQNNTTLLLVHAVHHAAQQALFSGKISKSILTLQQGLPPDSEFIDPIKKEADRRYADMQGWVGEWVSNLGKLASLVTARSGTLVSSYQQFQKEYESLRRQHQEIKDKLDFLGNEQKVSEEEDVPEKVIPIISLDIEEDPPKKTPGTPPQAKKSAKSPGSLSPMRKKPSPPTSKTPPLATKNPSSLSPSSHHAKTLPLKSQSKLSGSTTKKAAADKSSDKSGEKGEKSEKASEKGEKVDRAPKSPSKAPPPPKSAAAAVEVDKHLSEILAKLQVTGPITKIGDCQYQIGTKKVTMQIISGYLVVRVGGGFMKFEEWIQRFGRKEGLLIAGEAISGTGAVTLTAHGNVSVKAMPHKEKLLLKSFSWGGTPAEMRKKATEKNKSNEEKTKNNAEKKGKNVEKQEEVVTTRDKNKSFEGNKSNEKERKDKIGEKRTSKDEGKAKSKNVVRSLAVEEKGKNVRNKKKETKESGEKGTCEDRSIKEEKDGGTKINDESIEEENPSTIEEKYENEADKNEADKNEADKNEADKNEADKNEEENQSKNEREDEEMCTNDEGKKEEEIENKEEKQEEESLNTE